MDKNLGETDDSAVLIVLDKTGPALVFLIDGIHQSAAPETDVRLRILGIQSSHQVRPVQVS